MQSCFAAFRRIRRVALRKRAGSRHIPSSQRPRSGRAMSSGGPHLKPSQSAKLSDARPSVFHVQAVLAFPCHHRHRWSQGVRSTMHHPGVHRPCHPGGRLDPAPSHRHRGKCKHYRSTRSYQCVGGRSPWHDRHRWCNLNSLHLPLRRRVRNKNPNAQSSSTTISFMLRPTCEP